MDMKSSKKKKVQVDPEFRKAKHYVPKTNLKKKQLLNQTKIQK